MLLGIFVFLTLGVKSEPVELKFHLNKQQQKQRIEFDDITQLTIRYGQQFLVTFSLSNDAQNPQWQQNIRPSPRLDLVNFQIDINGNERKLTVLIWDPDEGDDEEDYTFETVDYNGSKSDSVYRLVLLKPPTELELSIINENGIIEGQNDRISKCIARGAKPQAEIRYRLISGGNGELEDYLETLIGTEEAMLELTPKREYHDAVIACYVLHETIESTTDNYPVNEVQWAKQIPALDVRYAPGTPKIVINEPQCDVEEYREKFTFSCTDGGVYPANPPVTMTQWTLPNGETRDGETVYITSNMLANGNGKIVCTTRNDIGSSEPREASIDELNQEACPAEAGAGLLILIILLVILVVLALIAVAYMYIKKKACFNKRESGDGMTSGYTDYDVDPEKHLNSYSQGNTLQAKHDVGQYDYQPDSIFDSKPNPPVNKPPYMEESDEEDNGPLLSSSANAKYHQNRRSESALRHSPSRGASPPKPDDNGSFNTDYNPSERGGTLHYATLDKDKLGARRTASPANRGNEIVYADLNGSHQQQDAYV